MKKDINKIDLVNIELRIREFTASKKYSSEITVSVDNIVDKLRDRDATKLKVRITLPRDVLQCNDRTFNVVEVLDVSILEAGLVYSSHNVMNYPRTATYSKTLVDLKEFIIELLKNAYEKL